jgi:hypothetical protein
MVKTIDPAFSPAHATHGGAALYQQEALPTVKTL